MVKISTFFLWVLGVILVLIVLYCWLCLLSGFEIRRKVPDAVAQGTLVKDKPCLEHVHHTHSKSKKIKKAVVSVKPPARTAPPPQIHVTEKVIPKFFVMDSTLKTKGEVN